MVRSYSIAEAKDNLARLVHDAQAGKPIELTRRGKPVAVVVSITDYARLSGDGPGLWERLVRFRDVESLVDMNGVFDDVRSGELGRDIELD